MARTWAQRQLYAELLERYGREVADAFFRALDDLRAGAELQRVIASLEGGDIEGALDALHIDPEAYSDVAEALRQAYVEGGRTAIAGLPKRRPDGAALVVRFDGTNPEAEAWLRDHSSRLITRITEDQREAVRTKAVAGMNAGQNPRAVALDIVGRLNRATGKREGGILGLTTTQAGYVDAAAGELAGDPAALKHYLTRTRRDKRFDRSVMKAIREGKPLPAEIAAKARTAYERRLLQLRGETIGRTEALTSLNAASYQAIRQVVQSGKAPMGAVRRVWRSALDSRVRHTHAALNGDTVGLEEAFLSPSGAMLMFPGDTSLGAPGGEVIGCRCIVSNRIDWLANVI